MPNTYAEMWLSLSHLIRSRKERTHVRSDTHGAQCATASLSALSSLERAEGDRALEVETVEGVA